MIDLFICIQVVRHFLTAKGIFMGVSDASIRKDKSAESAQQDQTD